MDIGCDEGVDRRAHGEGSRVQAAGFGPVGCTAIVGCTDSIIVKLAADSGRIVQGNVGRADNSRGFRIAYGNGK